MLSGSFCASKGHWEGFTLLWNHPALLAQPRAWLVMGNKQGVMQAPLLLCLQEKAKSPGADRGDTILCNSWHGDQAAHRGERRLRLAGPLSPVLAHQQRGIWEPVPVKDICTHKKINPSLQKAFWSANGCYGCLLKYLNMCTKDVNGYLCIWGLFVYANCNIAGLQTLPKLRGKKWKW